MLGRQCKSVEFGTVLFSPQFFFVCSSRQVDIMLPGQGNSNSHGARLIHQTISMIRWIQTSRLSTKNSLSLSAEAHTLRQTRRNQHPVGEAARRMQVPAPPPHYRGTSLIKNSTPLGPYSRNMPRALLRLSGGGLFLTGEVPMYMGYWRIHFTHRTRVLCYAFSWTPRTSLEMVFDLQERPALVLVVLACHRRHTLTAMVLDR